MFAKSAKSSCLLVTLITLIAALVPAKSYSQPASYFESTEHWYQAVSRSLGVTLEMCADSAVARGGYLASIHSQEENDFILLIAGTAFHVFIGGLEPSEGTWQWYSGEPWGPYTNWNAGEPNNCGGGACSEEVIQLYTSGPSVGKWNDCKNNDAATLVYIVEYDSKPTWADWCDDFDDGTAWQDRWQTLEGSQNVATNTFHSGPQSIEFHGTCGSTVIRRNFGAKEGYYTAWFNQQHHQAGFSMAIQAQPGAGVNPYFRDCYQIRLHAADAQPPGTFVFERQSSTGTGYLIASGNPTFLKDEWIQVFIRRLPGNIFHAGYVRNGVRDSLICVDPNPPIDSPGAFMLWACSDVPPYTYFDDVCYNSMSVGLKDTLRIGNPTCLQSLLPTEQAIPIYLDNRDTVKGFDIPLVYDWAFDPIGVSFDNTTRLGGHTGIMTGTIDIPNKRIRIGWLESTGDPANALPPVDAGSVSTPVAKIIFNVPYACLDNYVSSPDTARILLPTGSIGVEVSDKNGNPNVPVVVKENTRFRHFTTGDANWILPVTISDAVFLINYIFSGGSAPFCLLAADADCSGGVNISDAVYLINYIFAGGPVPGTNCLCGAPPLAKPTIGQADLSTALVKSESGNQIAIVLDASTNARATQIDFKITGDVRNIQIKSNVSDLQLFSREVDGGYRMGLIDLTGTAAIPLGKVQIATITYEGDGDLNITSAIVVDNDATEMNVEISNSKLESVLPTEYSLSQNQPNPFNPTTDISFSLPKTDQVKLVVYNILGAEVATLVDEVRSAGVHRVNWNGTNSSGQQVASGIYLYRLTAGDFAATKKMLLLK